MAHEGTIRQRVGSSGTVFICQVEVGRDPVTNERLYRTATAKTRREANTLLYELLKEVEGDVGRICAVYGDDEVGPASCPGGTGVRQVPGSLKTKTRPILADMTAAVPSGLADWLMARALHPYRSHQVDYRSHRAVSAR